MTETDLESDHAAGDGRFQLPYTRLSPSIPLNRPSIPLNRLSFTLNRRPNPPGQVPKDPIRRARMPRLTDPPEDAMISRFQKDVYPQDCTDRCKHLVGYARAGADTSAK